MPCSFSFGCLSLSAVGWHDPAARLECEGAGARVRSKVGHLMVLAVLRSACQGHVVPPLCLASLFYHANLRASPTATPKHEAARAVTQYPRSASYWVALQLPKPSGNLQLPLWLLLPSLSARHSYQSTLQGGPIYITLKAAVFFFCADRLAEARAKVDVPAAFKAAASSYVTWNYRPS
jgi:hypothetical protein